MVGSELLYSVSWNFWSNGYAVLFFPKYYCVFLVKGVMVAWTGIEHFRMGRFDPPPPANEPEDAVVCLSVTLKFGLFCHAFIGLILNSNVKFDLLSS